MCLGGTQHNATHPVCVVVSVCVSYPHGSQLPPQLCLVVVEPQVVHHCCIPPNLVYHVSHHNDGDEGDDDVQKADLSQ